MKECGEKNETVNKNKLRQLDRKTSQRFALVSVKGEKLFEQI